MKKYSFIFLSFCLFVLPLTATAAPNVQKAIQTVCSASARRGCLSLPFLPTVENTGLNSFQISRILRQRVERSFEEAVQKQVTIPANRAMVMGEPSFRLQKDHTFPIYSLYPDLSFLTTHKQVGYYLLSRNNRLFLQEFRRMEKEVWPQLDALLPRIKEKASALQQPLYPLEWIAKRIPQQVDTLFIGEVHDLPEIQEQIGKFLDYFLWEQKPEREIFLFTEFLPAEYEWGLPPTFHLSEQDKGYDEDRPVPSYLQLDYRPLWQAMSRQNVRVIGLESYRVMNDESQIKYVTKGGETSHQVVWASLEGIRLRNEQWKKIIAKYRQEYPQALFIVYTGAAHSFYNAPFSLTQGLKKENTFVLDFYPSERVIVKAVTPNTIGLGTAGTTDPLEQLTNFTEEFPQRVLYWEDPELAQVSGFDARLKVEVNLEEEKEHVRKWLRSVFGLSPVQAQIP